MQSKFIMLHPLFSENIVTVSLSVNICDRFLSLPGTPAGDADGLHHMNTKLTDVDEKEDEETERAVTPGERGGESFLFNVDKDVCVCVCVCVIVYVATWRLRRGVYTSRRRSREWRSWTRAWTGRSPLLWTHPHRTRPNSQTCWQTVSPCGLEQNQTHNIIG